MKITFYGAVKQVTGSKYLIEHNDAKILVDCGLFQGGKEITQHNWDPFPVAPETIDAIVLTHAHIDHTGYIPALVKNGFKGTIYSSLATYQMTRVLLIDAAHIQEEDAKLHHTATPLYTTIDAEHALTFFKPVDYDTVIQIKSLQVTLLRSGHILGSSFVIVFDGITKLTFSGDLGRPQQPLLKAPPYLQETDYLVLESTYGDRIHAQDDPEQDLSAAIDETVRKGGVILIPSFSVMRTQLILYYLYQLQQKNKIPKIPIYLDSPSAIQIDNLFCTFSQEYILPQTTCKAALGIAIPTPTVEQSKQIDQLKGSAIIIAGSGMAQGGRIPFHLQHYISDAKNTVLFVGYQAKDTQGRHLTDGAHEIYIDHRQYPVRAAIKTIPSLSAHADAQEIIAWLAHFEKSPKKVFITHGELEGMEALKKSIEERFNWNVIIPDPSTSFTLD
jgi:metallo-beta-lactamase family protein